MLLFRTAFYWIIPSFDDRSCVWLSETTGAGNFPAKPYFLYKRYNCGDEHISFIRFNNNELDFTEFYVVPMAITGLD